MSLDCQKILCCYLVISPTYDDQEHRHYISNRWSISMVQTESTKYEKRMLKIWEKWSPNGNEKALDHFISDSHPAIREIKQRVSGIVQQILYGIEMVDKKKRERLVEELFFRSFQYEKYNGKEYCKKNVDEMILGNLFGIYFGGSTSIHTTMGTDGQDDMKNWSGKSVFNFDHKDLDKAWEQIWEWNQEDQHYGSDELKDNLWSRAHFGLKKELLPKIQQAQALIPDELRKEIEDKLKKMNDVLLPIKSAWEQFDIDFGEGGKYEDMGWSDLEEKKLLPEPINKKHFAKEFWKDLNPEVIVKKFEDEKKAKAYKKDVGCVMLDVSEYGTTNILFKDHSAAQVVGYKSLENLKKGSFLGGNKERDYGERIYEYSEDDADGEIWFTPEWGECKDITDIEDFLKHIAKERKIKEAFFWCRWIGDLEPTWHLITINDPDCPEEIGEEGTIESMEKLLELRPSPKADSRKNLLDKHSYYHLKGGEIEEIVERDLPIKGLLSGDEDDLAHAYAMTTGKKKWKDSEGKTWDEDSWHRDRQPWDFPDEEEEED